MKIFFKLWCGGPVRVFFFFFLLQWISSFLNNCILGRMYILSFFSSIVTSILTNNMFCTDGSKSSTLHPAGHFCCPCIPVHRAGTTYWQSSRGICGGTISCLEIPLWAAAEAEFLFKLDYCSFYNYVFSHKKRRTYLFTEVNVPSGNSN